MKNLLSLRRLALFLCCAALLAACDDENGHEIVPPATVSNFAWVIVTQGNVYDGITGEVTELFYTTSQSTSGTAARTSAIEEFTCCKDLFFSEHGEHLGDTPQAPVRYGSKIYVPLYGSNQLAVLDAETLAPVRRVACTEPEAVCGAGGFVYVACNDGYVQRLDTLTLTPETSRQAVGPNPCALCTDGQKVYCAISDGYNYAAAYENGKRVAVLDAETGQKLADIPCGVNPTGVCCTADGTLFITCAGNYYDIASQIYVSRDGAPAEAFCAGTMCQVGGGRLFVVNAVTDWTTYATQVALTAYDAATLQPAIDLCLDADVLPPAPTALHYDATAGCLFLLSDPSAAGYNLPGAVYIYKEAPDGSFFPAQTFETGVHPIGMARQW